MFDPEKVPRIEWDSDTEGYWAYPSNQPKEMVTVLASDYDQLLALYREQSAELKVLREGHEKMMAVSGASLR